MDQSKYSRQMQSEKTFQVRKQVRHKTMVDRDINKKFYLEGVESGKKTLFGYNDLKDLQSDKSWLKGSGAVLNELHQEPVDLSSYEEYFDIDYDEDIAKFRARYI